MDKGFINVNWVPLVRLEQKMILAGTAADGLRPKWLWLQIMTFFIDPYLEL